MTLKNKITIIIFFYIDFLFRLFKTLGFIIYNFTCVFSHIILTQTAIKKDNPQTKNKRNS